jgi:hydrogenase expression/formation protein HypE
MTLPHGKIPIEILQQVIFKNLGAKRSEVVLGPSAGIDGAVIDFGNKSLIVSMDPITGALERVGWLAVNINANDVATFGVQPEFLLSCIMLPENSERITVETISMQMGKAAKDLEIAIIGGHCEVTSGLSNPIVVGCTIGTTEKGNYVTAGGAKHGDKIILTKSAGIEGTAILASDKTRLLEKTMSHETLLSAQQFFDQVSVVKEAIAAFKTGGVHAMHDPTEGGIAGGIHEMADASNLGLKVFEEKIIIKPETHEICNSFEIDPLQLISSGALLIATKPNAAESIIETLKENGIYASVIGEFLKKPNERILVKKNGKPEPLPKPASDHLWNALSQT